MCGKDMLETREYSYRGASIKYTCECGVSSVYYPGSDDISDGRNSDVFTRFYNGEEKEVYETGS